jgi:hypothetical protein
MGHGAVQEKSAREECRLVFVFKISLLSLLPSFQQDTFVPSIPVLFQSFFLSYTCHSFQKLLEHQL